jgi:hypothetical protein
MALFLALQEAEYIHDIAEKSPHQRFEDNMTMSVVITL